MDKVIRLNKLSQYLQQSSGPIGLAEIADQFDCSTRTIRRDLELLVQETGAPFFISDNRVYRDKSHSQKVPIAGYWLTPEELQALLILSNSLNQLQAGLLAEQLAPFKTQIERRLGQQGQANPALSEKIKIIQMASGPLNQHIFTQIAQALANQKRLNITFWSRQTNEINDREISPQQLIRYRDHWFLDAFCHHRQAIRSFSLEGIKQACLLEQAALEVQPQDLSEHFETSYGIFAGQADQQAVLNFSAYQARWTQFETWHPEQQACWLNDGRYQLTIPYKHDTELIQDILKHGPEIEVIEPPELRQKVKQRLEATLKQYSSDRI
ncbi:YafY family protein [Thiomicrospira sp. ALE5]|uniref:helix-turn-helix transcriptional regulator n=1 Tax=Thiomicrospira sp. ALE5 TaxID=748650 RepID=UPI0008EBE37F|nr:WYL domain-containing protein [Thiomicrospira sp. ALE5]SFR51598.1 Predicted DNA-binding transcriptional regulator YafY, contains an HTH and WYL domains [Thiomicrospira sp. ALE5]